MKTIAIVSQKGGVGKPPPHELGLRRTLPGFRPQLSTWTPGDGRKMGDRREADGPSVIGGQASRLGVILDTARANGAELVG